MAKNSKLTWILVVLLVGLWGTIAYQIVQAVSDEDSGEEKFPIVNVAKDAKLEKYVYTNDVRDPFRFFTPPVQSKAKKIVISGFVVPPPFRLAGIVANDKGRTAILESLDGSVFFVREKESLSGIRILRIEEKRVEYLYQNRRAEWLLAERI